MAAKKFVFNPDKCDDSPTNGKRAEVAEKALSASLKARGDPPRIDEDAVRDLMADLLHYCDREGYNVTSILWSVKRNWKAER